MACTGACHQGCGWWAEPSRTWDWDIMTLLARIQSYPFLRQVCQLDCELDKTYRHLRVQKLASGGQGLSCKLWTC